MRDWTLGPIGKKSNGHTVKVRTGTCVMLVDDDGNVSAFSPHEARMLGKALSDAANVAELRHQANHGDVVAKLIAEAEED